MDLLRDAAQPRSIAQLAEQLQVHPNTVRFHLEVLLRAGQVEQVLAQTTGPGRPPTLFAATRRMDPDGPRNYRLLATMLTRHLAACSPHPARTATELGRAWGPQLLGAAARVRPRPKPVRRGEALSDMTTVLTDLGFAPEPATGPRDPSIRLRHCPFLDLVTDSRTAGITTSTTSTRSTRTSTDAWTAGSVAADGGEASAGRGDGYGAVLCALHLGLMQGALASLRAPVTVDRLEPFLEPDLCVAHLAAPAAGRPAATGGTSGRRPRR